jgi:putative effector of murein hydrolase LrgA (UPF0299 family)
MLMVPMTVFFIPIAISVIHVVRSDMQSSFDGNFWYYFALRPSD